jgi:hypothetical protein
MAESSVFKVCYVLPGLFRRGIEAGEENVHAYISERKKRVARVRVFFGNIILHRSSYVNILIFVRRAERFFPVFALIVAMYTCPFYGRYPSCAALSRAKDF